jgi:Flp pilus assembly protein CpaB
MKLRGGTSTVGHRAGQDTPNGAPALDNGHGQRRVGRARRLPGGRALLGGFLVMLATVGAVALSRAAGAPATVPTVVASSPIAPFDPLGPHNLTVVDLALPDDLTAFTYADPASLSGTVSRSYLDVGEMLQRGAVVESTAAQRAAAPSREISLRIDLDRAVEGRLQAGDRVDVLATYGNGVDALTFVVLSDAPVLSAARVEGGVGSARSIVLTLALTDRRDTIALAHAVDNADLTVVRTTTAAGDSTMVPPFRPNVGDSP